MEKTIFNFSFSGISTILVYVFGNLDLALQFVILTMVIDYITGILKAIKLKQLNSKTGFKGIIHKIGILCLIGLVTSLDRLCGNTGLIRTATLYFIGANESLSIIENLGKIKVLVPEFIVEKLEQLKDGDLNGRK